MFLPDIYHAKFNKFNNLYLIDSCLNITLIALFILQIWILNYLAFSNKELIRGYLFLDLNL
jgi:hypothetical protein